MKKKLLVVLVAVLMFFVCGESVCALTATQLYNNAVNNILFYLDDTDEDSCNPSESVKYVATVTGDQITWIGDAWSIYASKVINTRYPGISLHAENSRMFSGANNVESGVDVVKRLAQSNALRKYVVFALGTNGGANKTEDEAKEMIDELLSAIGDNRMVVLMTARTGVKEYEDFNKAVKEVASSNDKVLLADWDSAAKDKIGEYFTDGKSALNEKGVNAFVQVFVKQFEEFASSKNNKATSTVGTVLGTISSGSATAEDNALVVANILRGAGYDGDAIAAFLGNLKNESGIEPRKLQGGKLADEATFDLASWSGRNKSGFGIAQWTSSGRQDNLIEFAKTNGSTIFNLQAQAAFIVDEAVNGNYKSSSGPDAINGKGIEYATFQIYRYYETPLSSLERDPNNQRGVGCLPSGGCSNPLSQTETAEAYKAYNQRLADAKAYLSLIEENGIAQGSGIVWSGGTGGSSGANGAICSTNMKAAVGIAQLAREMSWPDNNGNCLSRTGTVIGFTGKSDQEETCGTNPRDKNLQVLRAIGQNAEYGRDCSQFVGSVVKYLKLDDSFPTSGSGLQWQYLKYNNRSKSLWTIIENTGNINTTNLMPGDIAVYPNMSQVNASHGGGGGGYGHVQIFIGSLGGKWGNAAEASINHWVARVGNFDLNHERNPGETTGRYLIARYKGSVSIDSETDSMGDSTSSEPPEEESTFTVNNTCGTEKVSQGRDYGDTVSSDDKKFIARIVDSIGCSSVGSCRAIASYLLIKYENGNPEDSTTSLATYYKNNGYVQYANVSNEPSSSAYNAVDHLIKDKVRTLPYSTVTMLAPNGQSTYKIDGTNATIVKGSVAALGTQLSQFQPGVTTGVFKGYPEELKFYCGIKNSAGDYTYLFWQRDNKPVGQEVQ